MLRSAGQKPGDVWPMVALLYNNPAACQPAAPAGEPLLGACYILMSAASWSGWLSCLLLLDQIGSHAC